MQFSSNYTFEVSLSKESYSDKVISGAMIGTTKDEENRRIRKQYGFKANKGIGFERVSVTSQELLDSLLSGKVFCHLFNPSSIRKDGTFSSSQKNNENFDGSFVIGIDIDHTSYESAEDYVSRLTLPPTFYYTSYSNMQQNEDGTSKGARFRLIYVFDAKIVNPYFFRFCAYKLNRIIEEDTDELITDDCNLRCSQYFNGTNKENPNIILSYRITNAIYSLEDIDASDSNFIDFLCEYANYKTISVNRTSEIKNLLYVITNSCYLFNKSTKSFSLSSNNSLLTTTINVETETERQLEDSTLQVDEVEDSNFSHSTNTILNDWERLDTEEFVKCSEWENARRTTKYVYRIERDWINDLYQYVDEDYFSMFYYNTTQHDGQKRRKSLYQRMCLRRIINPIITKDEMVVNTIIDIIRFFDNSDGVLGSDYIRRNVESCFNADIEDLKEQYKDSINYLRETTKPKRGIIYKGRQAHSKETTFYILDELYNTSISVTDNLYNLNEILGYKFGKTTIYEYLKNREIKPVINGRISDEELIELLDVNLSVRKNMDFLKDNDIKVGNNRVNKLLNKKINSITNKFIQQEEESVTTTINVKTETERQSISNENVESVPVISEVEIIEEINKIDVTDFCKCYKGIEILFTNFKNNLILVNNDEVIYLYNNLMDKIEANSPFLADMGRSKMNQLIA